MIRYKIKVKNDHRDFSESFEDESLFLSHENKELMERIQQVVKRFNEEADEITIKVSPWEV